MLSFKVMLRLKSSDESKWYDDNKYSDKNAQLKKCSDENYQLKNKNAPFEKLWFSFFEEQISQY